MNFFYRTLYGRLIGSLALLLLCTLIFAGFLTQHKINAQINTNYDVQLIADANILWTLVHEELSENNGTLRDISLDPHASNLNDEQRQALSDYNDLRAFRIWSKGRLLVKSKEAAQDNIGAFTAGFSTAHMPNGDWRVYTLTYPDRNASVESWEHLDHRLRLEKDIFWGQLEIAAWGLPLLGALLLLTVFAALSSLARLTKLVQRRLPDELDDLANPDDVPSEVRPLVQSLNTMMTRIRDTIARERHFIDHVSHELRTPLTTIKILSQTIHQAPNEKERIEGLSAIEACVDNTIRMINQLLLLSQIEQGHPCISPISLSDLGKNIIDEFSVIADRKNINLCFSALDNAIGMVLGNAELILILIRVLVDNALKYTPENGTVLIESGATTLTISDTGPGIPAEERTKVLGRFYRREDTKLTTEGSGLGMAIAQKICEILNINMTLSDAPFSSGLRICLHFLPKQK